MRELGTSSCDHGFVETLSPRNATGWAWVPSRPDDRVQVDVIVDGEILESAIAGSFRQDLHDSGIGDGCHGFFITFREGRVSADRDIRFQISGTDVRLRIPSGAENWSPYEGAVELVNDQQIRGWVWDPERPDGSTPIEMLSDAYVVARTSANHYRQDLAAMGKGNGAHGFIIDLPPGKLWSQQSFKIVVAGTDFEVSSLMPGLNLGHVVRTLRPISPPPEALTARGDVEPSSYLGHSEFDGAYYRSRNKDLDFAVIDAERHFRDIGWKEGRSPNNWFSTIHYLYRHKDVLLSGIDPFFHYIRDGRREGRQVGPAPTKIEEQSFRICLAILTTAVDANFYRMQNSELDLRNTSPALHYLCQGWKSGRNPVPWFDVNYYLSAYPDVRSANSEPLTHFLNFGREEGRQPNRSIRDVVEPEFDTAYYVSQSPNLDGLEPVEHFVAYGWRQGLNPTASFDIRFYLRTSPDVKEAGINPFYHFITNGKAEARPSCSENLRRTIPDTKRQTLLFVGHDALHSGGQVVLLEIIKWFADHTRYPIKLLLLGLGPLVKQYAQYAETLVLPNSVSAFEGNQELASFLKGSFAACYVNTVAASSFSAIHERFANLRAVPIILHVHEMETVIREFLEGFLSIKDRTSSFIAVSEAVREVLQEAFDVPAEKIFLSNAFITPRVRDLHEISTSRSKSRVALGIAASSFVVMGCGTVYARKGPDLFIDVAEVLLSRHPDSDILFVWIGSGADLQECEARVQANSFRDRVKFVGFRNNANDLLSAADVLCLSSREDPFPLVCLEAAQYGVPSVFFSGASGIAEFVGDDAGTGIPSFDVNSMANVLRDYARNPLLRDRHGLRARAKMLEGYTSERRILEILLHLRKLAKMPADVSVLVLAYNHARFLRERLDSVTSQSLKDTEIFVLDDCSSDGTVAVAEEFNYDPRVTIVRNESNSGSPFKQWAMGVEMSSADFVWIAEGDDFASPEFLSEATAGFADPLVSIAFCKTEVVDEFGTHRTNALDDYYGLSEFPYRAESFLTDGLSAVEQGFGALCLIVNASSAVLRRDRIRGALAEAARFGMCGDWYAYLYALRRGKLFYTTKATNYFRRHGKSAVHLIEGTPQYFEERARIARFVIGNYHVSGRTRKLIRAQIDAEFYRFRGRNSIAEQNRIAELLQGIPTQPRAAPRKMRIGMYVHGMLFSKGGIERLAASLANELAWRGHEIVIFCREWGGARPVYPLFQSVRIEALFDENRLDESVPALRYGIARSDLDIFVPMLSEWLFDPIVEAAHGLGVTIIASEHNDPWKIEKLWWSHEKRVACFEKVDKVHLLLSKYTESLPEKLREKVTVIPNGVQRHQEDGTRLDSTESGVCRIVGIGRLERQKRFDRLINAFIAISDRVGGWRLDIFGEGSERAALQDIIDRNHQGGRVQLRGLVDDVHTELRNSAIFVIPSEFEGFGIVVIEAKNAGLPCIGYKDCNGPNELISDEIDGILVRPDQRGEHLSEAILRLILDERLREQFGQAASRDAAKFDLEAIVDKWEDFLRSSLDPSC